MTIPEISVYSAFVIFSETVDIKGFSDKEHLVSYARLTPRQDQSKNMSNMGTLQNVAL